MPSIIDKWVKDMLQTKDKLYEVNDICYKKIQNEKKIQSDIDKEIKSIKTRGPSFKRDNAVFKQKVFLDYMGSISSKSI